MPIGGGSSTSRNTVPVGAIMDFAHANDPSVVAGDWLECNGQNISRTTYATLFTAIGTTWGIGDGVTTFTLPDARRRVRAGKGGAATGTLGNTVGSSGGEETHTQTIAELAAHDHPGGAPVFTNMVAGGGNAIINSGNVGTTGSSAAFNVRDPSIICGVWIKT